MPCVCMTRPYIIPLILTDLIFVIQICHGINMRVRLDKLVRTLTVKIRYILETRLGPKERKLPVKPRNSSSQCVISVVPQKVMPRCYPLLSSICLSVKKGGNQALL